MKTPDQITPARIATEVLNEVRSELNLYEDNAEDGTTVQDAATDVIQRLHNLYGVMPIPQDTERIWYTCVDCDSGDMTEGVARWHERYEGHVVKEIDDMTSVSTAMYW